MTTKLEAGQTWSNGKTTRRITRFQRVTTGGYIYYKSGKSTATFNNPVWIFQHWIDSTNATLQETKP
jgi:hypothetical protein